MLRWSALVVLTGCAQIFGIEQTTGATDASIDTNLVPDAKPCTGGDVAMLDPNYAHCYTLFTAPVPRATAKTTCEMSGAHLARIENMVENNFVFGLVGDTGLAYLGGNDLGAEGTFVWDDGTLLTFVNWNTGEPNSGMAMHEEDCMVMVGASGGRWDDRPCSNVTTAIAGEYSFVCEHE